MLRGGFERVEASFVLARLRGSQCSRSPKPSASADTLCCLRCLLQGVGVWETGAVLHPESLHSQVKTQFWRGLVWDCRSVDKAERIESGDRNAKTKDV